MFLQKIILNLLVLILLIAPCGVVLAANVTPAEAPTFEYNNNTISTTTGLGSQNPVVVATYVINWLLGILGIVALGIIIYGGLIWMKARGNEEETTKAKNTLIAAVIGLIIILASYGLSAYIYNTLINISDVS